MTVVDQQLELLGSRRTPVSVEYQEETARQCKSRHHALVKCYEVSNLTPKQLFDPLKLDKTTFSRILSGTAFLPPDLKPRWMELCGNIIPVRYDALLVQHELRPIQSTLEAELEQAKADLRFERELNRRLLDRRDV